MIKRAATAVIPKIRSLGSPNSVQEESDQDLNQTYHYYKCPVFATSARLSRGGVAADNKPLFYIKLRTTHKPYRWVKRGVALLMEPTVICKL